MKRFIYSLLMTITALGAYANDNVEELDYLLLNNGNIVKGYIIKENPSNAAVTIKALNGEEYTYPQTEIRRINRAKSPVIPAKGNNNDEYKNYGEFKTGFWGAAEANIGYSCNINDPNAPFTGINLIGGYRFNDYLKIGVGIGSRYYISNYKLRASNIEWSFPIFANVRGNFMSSLYRTVVPYYSFEIGGAIRDGFFFSPTIGIRLGEARSAFLIGVSYTGQSMKGWEESTENLPPFINRKYVSFAVLKLGYEF